MVAYCLTLTVMKVQLFSLLIAITLFSEGCFLNKPESVQHIVKDFNLGWQGDPNRQALFVNIDHEEYGMVSSSVFNPVDSSDVVINGVFSKS